MGLGSQEGASAATCAHSGPPRDPPFATPAFYLLYLLWSFSRWLPFGWPKQAQLGFSPASNARSLARGRWLPDQSPWVGIVGQLPKPPTSSLSLTSFPHRTGRFRQCVAAGSSSCPWRPRLVADLTTGLLADPEAKEFPTLPPGGSKEGGLRGAPHTLCPCRALARTS